MNLKSAALQMRIVCLKKGRERERKERAKAVPYVVLTV